MCEQFYCEVMIMNKRLMLTQLFVCSVLFSSVTFTMQNDIDSDTSTNTSDSDNTSTDSTSSNDSDNGSSYVQSISNINASGDLQISQVLSGNGKKRRMTQTVTTPSGSSIIATKNNEDMVTKRRVNEAYVKSLSAGIYRKAMRDNFTPDLLVAVSPGGLLALCYLAGEPMFNNKNTRTIAVDSQDENGQKRQLKLLQKIHKDDYTGFKNILVIDSLVDLDNRLNFVVQELSKEGVPFPGSIIKTAALFYNSESTYKPHYFADQTKDLIIFSSEKL